MSDDPMIQYELVQSQFDAATLDRFEKSHREAINKYEKELRAVKMQNYLSGILSERMQPMVNKLMELNRVIDQVIENVDIQANKVD